MNDSQVRYLPISDFDPSELVKEFSDSPPENEEFIDDKFDIKNLSEDNLPEEVTLMLLGMGMEKYIKRFKKFNVCVDTFLNLNESDLQEIGITDPEDIQIITKNLSHHQYSKNDLTVSENHIEDLKIIKNVSNHLLLLQNYCAYVELQMKKQTLMDYPVDSEDSACTFLKAFAECALTQSKIMCDRIYDVNGSEVSLINKLLKTYNLNLPKAHQNSLPRRKGKGKKVLNVMIWIGFSSLLLLAGRYLMRRS